ncbi:MAG: GNAT family N-acetyltransferase, partial [Candidatus Thermoplasmatota archaeon]|nr:GNAT family N-acetyltransferase [Candidatus Thermoplasmatota archaeon]
GTRVLFREPRPKDAVQLMRFINALVVEKRSGLLMNTSVGLEDERAWLKSWRADIRRRKGVMLLVEVDGRIVGNCTVSRLPWKTSHAADVGIALSREMRGKGIGEALMINIIELARRRMRGLEMLHLKTLDYNERAQALYKRIGFIEVGRIPKANKEGKEYHDDVLMVKFLQE